MGPKSSCPILSREGPLAQQSEREVGMPICGLSSLGDQ